MWVQVRRGPLTFLIDETLPNFKKRKHPRKGEGKKKQRARTKVQASRQPKRGMPQRGNKGTTKYRNLHQLHEAYQLKEGRSKPHKGLFNPLLWGEESRLDQVDKCFIYLTYSQWLFKF